jgi:hypothetical protein
MSYIFKKYEFPDEAAADALIDALPSQYDEELDETHPNHKHVIVKLYHPIVEQPIYDDEGNIETDAVLAENFSVDVLWQGIEAQPTDWEQYEITLSDNGVHSFFGIDYI